MINCQKNKKRNSIQNLFNMEKLLNSFRQFDFSAGLVAGINESLAPRGSVGLAINFDFDVEIGSATTRPGTFIIGGQMVAGNSILGLHNHVAGSTSTLFSAINDVGSATAVIYDQAGDVRVTGLTANKKVRMLTFNAATLIINGADAEQSYTAAGGFITTGGAFDLANIPGANLNNLCTVFLDRVYLAGDTANPARLYYSGVSSGGTVSWTSGNGNIDIDVGNDKGAITALGRVPGYILIFKNRSMTRWNYSSAFPEELISYGTPSQESVVSAGGVCAFYSNSNEHDKGFFITNGGAPVPISHDNARPIRKWVDAIDVANEANIAGRAINNGFAWSIGDVTVDRQLYHNVELRYNRILNQWSVRMYPTKFTVYASYLDGQGRNVTVAGDTDGQVLELDRPERFVDFVMKNGEPGESSINFQIETHSETHGFNNLKQVADVLEFSTINGQGSTPYVMVDGNEVVECTSLDKDIGAVKLPKNLVGARFAYGLKGSMSNGRLVLKEICVPNISVVAGYN